MDIFRNTTFIILFLCVKVLTSRTIKVDQKNGIDDKSCRNGSEPCKTLNYVFSKSGGGDMLNKTEVLLYPGVHELNDSISLEYIDHMSIVSNQSAVINCTRTNSGFTYKYVSNIKIENIAIQNCGVRRQSTTVIYNNSGSIEDDHPYITIGVTFIYSNSIKIAHANFWHNKGVALAFYDVGTYIKVEDSDFSTNLEDRKSHSSNLSSGGGVHIEYTQCGALPPFDCTLSKQRKYNHNTKVNIARTSFQNNSAENRYNFSKPEIPLNKTYITYGKGGGVSIYVFGNAKNNTFTFSESHFNNNQALWGGAIDISFKGECESNRVSIKNLKFENNVATYAGGAIRIESIYVDDFNHYTQPRKLTFGNTVHIHFSNFTSNSAIWGGGLSIYGTTRVLYIQNPEDRNYVINHCNFVKNYATVGFAVGLSTINLNPDVIGPGLSYHFVIKNCTFAENIMILTEDRRVVGQGVIYSEQAPVILQGVNSFCNNTYTAVVLDSSSLNFSASSTSMFYNNKGIKGGAIALYGLSWIMLGHSSTLLFKDNEAILKGGAIYTKDSGPGRVSFKTTELTTSGCFIRYEEELLDPNTWPVSVIFSGNKAPNGSGNSVFASTLQYCRKSYEYRNDFNALNWTSLKYLDNTNGQAEIVTDAVNIRVKESQWDPYPFLPFSPDVTLLDEKNQSVFGSVKLEFNGTAQLEPPNDVFLIRNKLARLRITGKTHSRFMFHFSSTSGQIFKSRIYKGQLENCPPGFQLDEQRGRCKCMDETDVDVIHCLENGTVYILKGKWGYISNTTNTLETRLCPSHYCRCNEETIDTLCVLDLDKQCQPKRRGNLCSECDEGLSVVLGSEECKKCSNSWLAILLLMVLVLSIFVIAILYFKIDAFSGYLNAYFYSYQMILLLIPENVNMDVFISFIIGTTGFSGTGGKFGVCIFNGMDNLDKIAVNYIAPAWMVIFTVFLGLCIPPSMWECKWCRRKREDLVVDSVDKKKKRRTSFGRAFCFVAVISYSGFTGATIKFFKYVNIDGHKYVYDAAFQHYGTGKHIGYLLLASIVGVFIVLGFPIILTLHVSLAYRIPRLLALDPIFEALKTCFKENMRFFASFYFFCRVAMLIASIFIEEEITRLIVLSIMSFIFTLLFACFQPYKRMTYNIWDIILLTNLCVIGLLSLIESVPFAIEPENQTKVITLIKALAYVPLLSVIVRLAWHMCYIKRRVTHDHEDGRRDTGKIFIYFYIYILYILCLYIYIYVYIYICIYIYIIFFVQNIFLDIQPEEAI